MKLIETTKVKVKKSDLFGAAAVIFLLIVIVTIIRMANAYNEFAESAPEPLTDTENIELIQFNSPAADQGSAVFKTDEGDITVTLYESYAPKAVEIFRNAAENGSMNGISCGLYEQGSIFTLDLPNTEDGYTAELDKNLWPFKGALCMTENGDIIFINTIEFSDEDREYLSAEGELYNVRKAFLENGGVPDYSRQYAVFGQVTQGLDVLEKIARTPAEQTVMITEVVVE